MKTKLWALFKALPPVAKFLWVLMGVLPLLLGMLGEGYALYWQLTPDEMYWADFPPDARGFLGNFIGSIAITGVAALLGAYYQRQQRTRERLMQLGQRIDPPVAKVEESLWRGSGGTHYYYIYSYWQDPATGKRHTFESEWLDFDANQYLRQGDSLPIYFMPGDFKHYYFDVSSLPRPKRLFGL